MTQQQTGTSLVLTAVFIIGGMLMAIIGVPILAVTGVLSGDTSGTQNCSRSTPADC